MDFRRPKRQRTPTTQYTDDQPGTFTIKPPRGQRQSYLEEQNRTKAKPCVYYVEVDEDDETDVAAEQALQASVPTLELPNHVKRRPYRERKPYSKHGDDFATTPLSPGQKTHVPLHAPSAAVLPEAPVSSDDPPPPVKRKRGRPPKKRPSLDPSAASQSSTSSGRASSLTSTSTVTRNSHRTDSASSNAKKHPCFATSTTARGLGPTKRGRPPSKGTHSSAVNHKRRHAHHSLLGTNSWTPALRDVEGTFVNHAVQVIPILPPPQSSLSATTASTANTSSTYNSNTLNAASTSTNGSSSTTTSIDSIVYGKGLGSTRPLEKPTWTPLMSPPIYFEQDYGEDGKLLRKEGQEIWPVTRSITSMTTRKPDGDYLCVGDTAGLVSIYALHQGLNRLVARLETVACQTRAIPEQEQLRDQLHQAHLKNKKKPAMDKLILQHQNKYTSSSGSSIQAMSMVATRVILATTQELECLDVPTATSLWVCPLDMEERIVTHLDMHWTNFDVLVSCRVWDDSVGQVSPLRLLKHSSTNVEVCDANAPLLLRSPCCTAIWDTSPSKEQRLLLVTWSGQQEDGSDDANNGNGLELVLVQGGASVEEWNVSCKAQIPAASGGTSNPSTSSLPPRLSQSSQGMYTLVACSRGIRLYQTESLQLLNVYGDQLALHGQSVIWQDCLLLSSNSGQEESGSDDKKQGRLVGDDTLEYDDWLKQHDDGEPAAVASKSFKKGQNKIASTTSDLGHYVVGIPQALKEPKELTEALHVWRVDAANTVPAFSLPLPPKSEGVHCLVKGNSSQSGMMEQLILVNPLGEAFCLRPTVRSDFAGIMYPPGYQVVTDNLVYVEDEDKMDRQHNNNASASATAANSTKTTAADSQYAKQLAALDEDDDMDDDLKEALRQSLLEQHEREAVEDSDVDILGGYMSTSSAEVIPCRPELHLRQAFLQHSDDEDNGETDLLISENSSVAETNESKPAIGLSFIDILNGLPHVHKRKSSSGGEFGFTVTAKVIVAATAPQANRPGRGKRSRAANLEALLKSSIDPNLQRLMNSKQSSWTSGRGSALAASNAIENRKVAALPTVSPSPEKPEQLSVDNRGDGSTGSTPAIVPSQSDQPAATNVNDEEAGILGLLSLSPPKKSSAMQQTNGNANGGPYLDAQTLAQVDVTPSKHTECAVASDPMSSALGLNHVVYQRPHSRATSSEPGSTEISVELGSAEEKISAIFGNQQKKLKYDPSCFACRGRLVIHTCGQRSLPIDHEEVARVEKEQQAKEEEAKKKARVEKRRLAEQRRRVARRQNQRELEAQRRRGEEEMARTIEQSKQAMMIEAQNERNSEQKRRELIMHSYKEHLTCAVPTAAPGMTVAQSAYSRQQSPQTLLSSYSARPQAYIPPSVAPAYPAPAAQVAAPVYPTAAPVNSPAAPLYAKSTPVHPVAPAAPVYLTSALQATAPVHPAVSRFSTHLGLSTAPSRPSTAAATFSPADALFALAGLAGTKPQQPEPATNGFSSMGIKAPLVPARAAPNPALLVAPGLGTSSAQIAAARSVELKSGIPSYAAILGQHTATATENSAAAKSFVTYHAPMATSDANGGATGTATYLWPPRQQAPAAAPGAQATNKTFLSGTTTPKTWPHTSQG